MASIIPPLNSNGIWDIKEPIKLAPNSTYQCIAVRYFEDLIKQRINIFMRYYEPWGLTIEDYQRDLKNKEAMVTLASPVAGTFIIPSSYINKFPLESGLVFRHVVLSVDLGLLPTNDKILDNVIDKIKNATETALGVKSTVMIHSIPTSTAITPSEALALEDARAAAISDPRSDAAIRLALENENEELQKKVSMLEEIILQAGLA